MAHDYEDLHDLDDLSDDELRELVRDRLAAHNGIDADDITVVVEDGNVHLSGRVGTEGERRIAEHVVTDVLGIQQYENDLVVDSIRRAESPEAIDEHLLEEEATEGLLLGDRPVSISPEAEHLDDGLDAADQSQGTADVQRAIEKAAPWIPPESPTPEGMGGTESETRDMGEHH